MELNFHTMQNHYSAPRPDLRSVTFEDPVGKDVILNSQKPVVVLVTNVLAEGIERHDGSGLRPIEEGGDGFRVRDTDVSQHEFDTVTEAKAFAKSQRNPDSNPVETKILEFRNRKWRVIEHLEASA